MSQPLDSRQMSVGPYSAGSQLSPFSSPPPPPSQPTPRPAVPLPPPLPPPVQQTSPSKDSSPTSLCRMGQELVQEIIARAIELFNFYNRSVQQLQTVNNTERKAKVEELVRRIESHFQRLRRVYDAVNEMSSDVEPRPVEDLLPIIDIDGNEEALLAPEPTKPVSEEQQDLMEQVRAKNRYLKQIIDQQRIIIWEINTMLAMRKTTQ